MQENVLETSEFGSCIVLPSAIIVNECRRFQNKPPAPMSDIIPLGSPARQNYEKGIRFCQLRAVNRLAVFYTVPGRSC